MSRLHYLGDLSHVEHRSDRAVRVKTNCPSAAVGLPAGATTLLAQAECPLQDSSWSLCSRPRSSNVKALGCGKELRLMMGGVAVPATLKGEEEAKEDVWPALERRCRWLLGPG